MTVFLDTNIPLDVLMQRPCLVDESAEVITRCGVLGCRMFIAWHGLATAFYLLKRGRSLDAALEQIDQILEWAAVVSCGDAEARKARHLGFTDFEDALQAVSASASGADWIVTRNEKDFAKSIVPALTPTEFLARFPVPQT